MLVLLPIVLVCAGFQACFQAVERKAPGLHPAFPVDVSSPLRAGIAPVPLPSLSKMSRARTQPPLKMAQNPTTAKGAIVCALILAGMGGGAGLGMALDRSGGDSPGLGGFYIGMTVGAAAGGVLGWMLVK